MPEICETCGKRLARAIKASRCTKEDVAMGAGISRSVITAYLKDQDLPSHAEAARMADLLGTTPEWLLQGTHPGKPRL